MPYREAIRTLHQETATIIMTNNSAERRREIKRANTTFLPFNLGGVYPVTQMLAGKRLLPLCLPIRTLFQLGCKRSQYHRHRCKKRKALCPRKGVGAERLKMGFPAAQGKKVI